MSKLNCLVHLYATKLLNIDRLKTNHGCFTLRGCQSVSTVDLQGVCMTKQECEDGGGTTDGNCAAG